MASWKKVIVSGSSISQLDNDAGYIASVGGGIVSSSDTGDAQGQIKINGVNVDVNNLSTLDSPEFITVEVGHPSDTTLGRASAGVLQVEGIPLLRAENDGILSGSGQIATEISGAFTLTSASIASDIAALEAAQYDLDVAGDSGTGTITNAETFTISGTANEIETSMSGNTLTIGLPTNVTIAGDLTVAGDLVSLNVANLDVEDKFILLNSGSASGDSGIVFGGSNGTAQEGMAILWDDDTSVFGFAEDVARNATGAAPDSKLGNIQTNSGGDPSGAPTFQGVGTINVRTDDQTIWIYS
jgi:hypothetical protein